MTLPHGTQGNMYLTRISNYVPDPDFRSVG